MNGIGRGERSGNSGKISIFTKETVGMTLLLFGVIALVITATGPYIFADVGLAIAAFFMGASGFFAFPLLIALILASVMLIAGKKLFSLRWMGRIMLLLIPVFFIVHTATAERFFQGASYGAYLHACWTAAVGGIGGATGGGVLFGVLAYPLRYALSAVGAYIIYGVLTALALFYLLLLTPVRALLHRPPLRTRTGGAGKKKNDRVSRPVRPTVAQDPVKPVAFNDLPTPTRTPMPDALRYPSAPSYGAPREERPSVPYGTPYGQTATPAPAQPLSSREILFGNSPAENYRNNLVFDENSSFNTRPRNYPAYPAQTGGTSEPSAPASSQNRPQTRPENGYSGSFSEAADQDRPPMPRRVRPVERNFSSRDDAFEYPQQPAYHAPASPERSEPERDMTPPPIPDRSDRLDPTPRFDDSSRLSDPTPRFDDSSRLSDPTPRFDDGSRLSDPTPRFDDSSRLSDPTPRFDDSSRLSDPTPRFDDSSRLSDPTSRFDDSSRLSDPTSRFDDSSRLSDPISRFDDRNPASEQFGRDRRDSFDDRRDSFDDRRDSFDDRRDSFEDRRDSFDDRRDGFEQDGAFGTPDAFDDQSLFDRRDPDGGRDLTDDRRSFDSGRDLTDDRRSLGTSNADLFDDDEGEGDYRSGGDLSYPEEKRPAASRGERGLRDIGRSYPQSAASPDPAPAPVPMPAPVPAPAPKPKKRVMKKYRRPSLNHFQQYDDSSEVSQEEIGRNSGVILDTLRSFKIEATIAKVTCGARVTRYDIEIPKNVPVGMVTKRDRDIGMRLMVRDGVNMYVNNETGSVSIEVPNKKPATVGIRSILFADEYTNAKPSALVFALGKDIEGRNVCGDIVKMKHLLIAGSTGSGKSVCLNSLLISLICKYSPEDLRLILIDPKRVEFAVYDGIPHLMINEIITEAPKAVSALNWALKEMERRYGLFEQKTKAGNVTIQNIDSYNENRTEDEDKLPKIVIVFDELADFMMVAKKDIEERIQRLTAKARAAGIHLVIATQRPSVDVITGVIKGNLPTRIAFRTIQEVDSRTILDESGAEKLLGNGDMLYRTEGMFSCLRVQGSFLSGKEIHDVIADIKENNESYYDEEVSDYINRSGASPESSGGSAGFGDGGNVSEIYIKALAVVVKLGQASISLIQRRCGVGYNHAGKIIEWMESMSYISPFDGKAKARTVLLTKEEYEAKYGPLE